MIELKNINNIEICVSSICNLSCKHCYQHFDKNKHTLELNKIIEIIDFACVRGCKSLVLSGGEIFLYSDVFTIFDYAKHNQLELVVVTNGTLVDIDKIKKYINSNILFQISIDGNEYYHDNRRGKGTYKKTYETIKELKELGFRVRINVTLDTDNIFSIESILNDSNFSELSFLPVANTGAAKQFINTEITPVYEKIIKHLYMRCSKYRPPDDRCNIFPNGFSVNYDGSIYPCSLARDFELLKIGNINHSSIEEIMNRFLESDVVNIFKNYSCNSQITECELCDKSPTCPRGCRIRAYKFKGSLLTPDPFACKVYKNAYSDISASKIYWGEV